MPYASKEKRSEYNREYKRRYREKILSGRRMLYRIKNPKKRTALWYEGHLDAGFCKSCRLNTYKKPPQDCVEPKHSIYYKKRRDVNNSYRKKIRAIDPTKYNEPADKRNKRLRTKMQEKRKSILELLGNKCSKCGFNDLRALQIDHINGGGGKERAQKGWQYRNYLYSLSSEQIISKYQCLCANCHAIKTTEEIWKRQNQLDLKEKEKRALISKKLA